ncbi:MAG: type IV pilus assembly protein FimV [Methylophilaceae bacterium]
MNKLKLFFTFFVLSLSSTIYALQIGTFKILSYQDTPLKIQVDLSLAKDDNIESLKPSIAPKADFDAAGIPRLPIHDQMIVELKQIEEKPYIELTTNSPIKDSYMDILLQVESEKGRSLKEFTVLLDPVPVTRKEDLENAKLELNKADIKKEAQLKEIKAEQIKDDSKGKAKVGAKTTVSQAGKTLFQIARENSISGITTEQFAVAIFQINPKAFAKNNMNGLMRGKKLTLPSKQYFEKLSHMDARKILRDQNNAWNEINRKKPSKKIKPDVNPPKIDNKLEEKNEVTSTPAKKANSISGDTFTDDSNEEKLDIKGNETTQELGSSDEPIKTPEIFESSIVNEDEPIIEEVITEESNQSESNSTLMYLLLTLFAVLGIFLVYLSKKKVKLKNVNNPTYSSNTHEENIPDGESPRFEPQNYSYQENELESEAFINESQGTENNPSTPSSNNQNEVNVSNMTSVDAYIFNKNKQKSD